MNKQNKILLGLLAFVVACTIGYALFSETIIINGTVTAKGDWEVTTTCGVMTYEQATTMGIDVQAGKTGPITELSKNAIATCSNNTANLGVELTAPGARTLFYVTMTNTGTIPFTLSEDNPITLTPGANSKDYSGVMMSTVNRYVGMVTKDFYLGNTVIEDLPVVQPGEALTVVVIAEWTDSDENATGTNTTVSGTYTLNLEQIKAQ